MDDQRDQGIIRPVLRGMALGGIAAGLLFGALAEVQIHRLPKVHAETAEEYDTVSGRLSMVNVAEKKGTLATDIGKEIAFQIVKPELFLNLSVGQRVTLKLDKQGRAVRVMDTAAPELPPPSVPR